MRAARVVPARAILGSRFDGRRDGLDGSGRYAPNTPSSRPGGDCERVVVVQIAGLTGANSTVKLIVMRTNRAGLAACRFALGAMLEHKPAQVRERLFKGESGRAIHHFAVPIPL